MDSDLDCIRKGAGSIPNESDFILLTFSIIFKKMVLVICQIMLRVLFSTGKDVKKIVIKYLVFVL